MRIQYDIDEFMKNANQYLNNSNKMGCFKITEGILSSSNYEKLSDIFKTNLN